MNMTMTSLNTFPFCTTSKYDKYKHNPIIAIPDFDAMFSFSSILWRVSSLFYENVSKYRNL